MNKTDTFENWKEEFEKRLWQYDNRIDTDEDAWNIYWKDEWESFISSLLARQRHAVLEEVKRIITEEHAIYANTPLPMRMNGDSMLTRISTRLEEMEKEV